MYGNYTATAMRLSTHYYLIIFLPALKYMIHTIHELNLFLITTPACLHN